MVSIAFLKLLQTNKSKNCLDLNDSINDAVSAYHERYIQLKYVYFWEECIKLRNRDLVNQGENPISISEQRTIEGGGKEKNKEKEGPKEKKMAHRIDKTEGKLGKLAPPKGWQDPNAGNKQSAQNFINLLDMDDEEERQSQQQQQQPQPIKQENSLPQQYISKPKRIEESKQEHPQIININLVTEKKEVDLLDMDDDNDQKQSEIMQPVMAGDTNFLYRPTEDTSKPKTNIQDIQLLNDDNFGEPAQKQEPVAQ